MLKGKRIRIFAGPNGSGKSSAYEELSKKYSTGVYINSDNIEKELRIKRFVDLNDYSIIV